MTTTNDTIGTKRTVGSTNVVIVLAVLAAAGLAAWIYQLSQGMHVTGLSQQVVWALYIAAFFSAVGAGAGLLFLVGLSEFNALIPAEKRRYGLLAALGSFVAGGLLIMMDVGNPLQVWRIITAGRFTSMMTWDFWLLTIAGLVTLGYLFLGARSGIRKWMAVLAMASAVAVVVVEGWMLSSLSARPALDGGATVVSFLLAALLGGLALWVLVDEAVPAAQLGWLKLVLVASLVVVLAEVLTRQVSGSPRSADEIGLVLGGTAAPLFWFHILIGLVLPLMLLSSGRNIKIAAFLVLLGVLAEKSWLLVVGQVFPWLQFPQGAYFFTLVELVAVVGAAAIGALAYLVLKKVLVKPAA